MLKEYENVFSGSAKLIFDRAKQEQEFRHELGREQARLEHRTLSFAGWQGILGQVFAFVIALVAIGGGIYLLANNNKAGGLASIISALAALVAVFITNKLVDYFTQLAEDDASQGNTPPSDVASQ